MCVRKEKVQEKFMLSWGFHIHCSSGCQEPKNPSILSSHSQKTKEKEQTNKTANFKCNSGSQQQLTPHNPMNERPHE
jgi:hypothetical protein